jgi:hypothetical protein
MDARSAMSAKSGVLLSTADIRRLQLAHTRCPWEALVFALSGDQIPTGEWPSFWPLLHMTVARGGSRHIERPPSTPSSVSQSNARTRPGSAGWVKHSNGCGDPRNAPKCPPFFSSEVVRLDQVSIQTILQNNLERQSTC